MSDLLSPFAPLWPWLVPHRDSRIPGTLYRIFPETCRLLTEKDIGTPSDRLVDGIDLRDLATRAVVLRTLASIGHPRPWALGEGFGSNLGAERAGRVVAEMVRRAGPEPGKGTVIPTGVLGPWMSSTARDGISFRGNIAGAGSTLIQERWPLLGSPSNHWQVSRNTLILREGPETGLEGRVACDLAARALGSLMIEDVTP